MIQFGKAGKCLLAGAVLLLCGGPLAAQVVLPPIGGDPSSSQAPAVSLPEEPSLEEKVKQLEQELMKLKMIEQELAKLKEQARKQQEEKKKKEEEEKKKKEEESDPKKIAEKLKKLEDEWEKQKEEKQKEEEEEKKKHKPIEWSGRIFLDSVFFAHDSAGIGAFEHPDTGVDPENAIFFRRLRFTARGEVLDNMEYKVDFDLAKPEDFGFRDAYLAFTNLPGNHTLRIGNQKRPFGLDQLNSSNVNVFMERPLVIDAFTLDYRRIGVQLLGYTDDEVWNWQTGFFAMENVAQTTGRAYFEPPQWNYSVRLAGTPWYDECSGGRNYLHLAVSNMIAFPNGFADDNDSSPNQARFTTISQVQSATDWLDTGRIVGADWLDTVGLEAALNVGPFSLVSEYMASWVGRDRGPGVTDASTLFFHGFYVYAAYFLTGEAQAWDRKTGTLDRVVPFENFFLVERLCGRNGGGWGAWQLAVRYDFLNLSDGNVLGGRGNNCTIGLNWWWNTHARLMVNYVFGEIDNHRPVRGFTEGNFNALTTRMQIDF